MNIGIVGGGQLGQMLAHAGLKLGHSFKFLVPQGECCVEALGEVIRGDFTDTKLLIEFARGLDASLGTSQPLVKTLPALRRAS